MARGTRAISVLTAWVLAFGQAIPVASASITLRPRGRNGATGGAIRGDTAWVWGPGGAGMGALGRRNLVQLGKRVVEAAFAEGRAYAILGPGSRPIEEQVQDPVVRQRLENVRAKLGKLSGIGVPIHLPGIDVGQLPTLDEVARLVIIRSPDGLPALVSNDEFGSATHHALVAYGSEHQFEGWNTPTAHISQSVREQLGAKNVYLNLEQLEGLLAQGEAGERATQLMWRHEVTDAVYGHHVDEPQEIRDQIDGPMGRVFEQYHTAQQSAQAAQAARRAEYLKTRKENARKAAEKLASRVQLVPYVMNLGRFFNGRVPDYVIQQLEADLRDAAQQGAIKDALVKRFNQTVLLEVHYNGPSRNPEVDRMVVDLVSDALTTPAPEGTETVPLTEAYTKEVLDRPYLERASALRIRTGQFGFDERGSEPIYVSTALGGGPAAYNWVVMRLLNEAVQNQLKIEGIRQEELAALRKEYERYQQAKATGEEDLAKDLEFNAADLARAANEEGPGYVVVVEKIADILAGNRDRTAYRFVFPRSAPYIHTLVNDQTEWVITKVLPRPGSRLYDTSKAPENQDPMLEVMVDQIGNGVQTFESFNPVFVAKQQSGAPAIGEFVSATTQFFLTTGGTGQGTVHRGVIPTTFEEADAGAFDKDGLIQMVSYTFQSYDNGKIPHSEVPDQVKLSTDVMATRDEELSVHRDLMLLGSFQPAVTAPEAVRRAEHAVEQLGARYHEIPAVVELDAQGNIQIGSDGKPVVKLDPVLETSNQTKVVTISDLKADIGATGHQEPYKVLFAAFRASLKVAQKQGLIDAYDVANAGDDNHFILFHRHGVDDADIHTLAWHTFFRAGWLIKQLGYKTYGFMQDLVDPKVQQLIKQGKLEAYANLTDEFIEALGEEIQSLPEAAEMDKIRAAYDGFKSGKSSGTVVELPFSGNVRGMGIGFAEKTISAAELAQSPNWSIIANDKGAAGAFNYPAYWAARIALAMRDTWYTWHFPTTRRIVRDRLLQEVANRMPDVPETQRVQLVERWLSTLAPNRFPQRDVTRLAGVVQHGLVFETWDVLPNSRAFVDAESEDDLLVSLLSAANDHNIKRIWTKKRAGWIGDLTEDEVAAIEARVEASLPAVRAEYEQRKVQLQADVAAGRQKVELLNPWERAILDQPVEMLVATARPRLVELAKVREFLGDDYIASVSTEKLAAVTGGEYVGKDDSVMVAIDPFASLHRAITKTTVRVNIGNARGSHWVAMRPEGRKTAIAVKWSNPIEISIRYTVELDGTVARDKATGLAIGEDVYGEWGYGYDETRMRVAKFNKMWIDVQGGFTPHGPNIDRDIEAAYPARKTRNMITAKNSPFAVPVTDTTVTAVEQGRLVNQFPEATDVVISPQVAEQAADLDNPRWVVVHSSVDADGPDAAIAIARIQSQLRQIFGNSSQAWHWAYVAQGTSTNEQAEKLFAGRGSALKPFGAGSETFELVLPESTDGQLLGVLEAAVPGSRVATVIGPAEWAKTIKETSAKPEEVAAIAFEPAKEDTEVASGAAAVIAGVEAAAAGGQLKPELAAKLKALEEGGLIVPPKQGVVEETAAEVRNYQTAVAEAGIKG